MVTQHLRVGKGCNISTFDQRFARTTCSAQRLAVPFTVRRGDMCVSFCYGCNAKESDFRDLTNRCKVKWSGGTPKLGYSNRSRFTGLPRKNSNFSAKVLQKQVKIIFYFCLDIHKAIQIVKTNLVEQNPFIRCSCS